MKTRATLALVLVCGSNAAAQPLMQVEYSWSEVVAGTTTPVSSPNSILEPGEGALIRLDLMALVDGADAVGRIVSWTSTHGDPGGSGTVRGIGTFVYDLVARTAAYGGGTWSGREVNPILSFGSDTGSVAAGGEQVLHFGGGQFPFPGTTANGTNPIDAAWSGVWNPVDYSPRVVNFVAQASYAVPIGRQNSMYVQIRTDYADPSDPTTAYAVYTGVFFPTNFGIGMHIPLDLGPPGQGCYPNCDNSAVQPVLNILDFQCYINKFAIGDSYANCDGSTAPPVLNANDFQCFLGLFAAGCT